MVVGIQSVARAAFGPRRPVGQHGRPTEARRQGWGRRAIETAIAEARQRGDSLQLEVLTDNTGAVELYRSAGFQVSRTLLGFHGSLDTLRTVPPSDVDEIPLAQTAALVGVRAPGLPWQLGSASLHGLGTGWRAWTNGPAYAISRQRHDTLALLSVLALPEARRRGDARGLLSAIAHATPGATRAQIISDRPSGGGPHVHERLRPPPVSPRQYEMRL